MFESLSLNEEFAVVLVHDYSFLFFETCATETVVLYVYNGGGEGYWIVVSVLLSLV